MTTNNKNVGLDAILVHAAMSGEFIVAAIGLGLTPNEAHHRSDWLKSQSDDYIKQVSDKVVEIEGKNL